MTNHERQGYRVAAHTVLGEETTEVSEGRQFPETRTVAAEQLADRYSELQARATTSCEHWVGSEELGIRARDDARRLGDHTFVDGA